MTSSERYLPSVGVEVRIRRMKGRAHIMGHRTSFFSTNCHLYHSAGNNPVRYVDPDGRSDKVFNRGGHFVEIIESETNNIHLRDGYLEFNHLVAFDVLLTTQEEFESLVNKVYGETASLRPESNNLKALLDARAAIAHVAQNASESSMRSAEANLDNPIEFRELTRIRASVIQALTDKDDPTDGAVHFNFRGKDQGNPTQDKHKIFGNVTAAFGLVNNPIKTGDAPKGDIYIVTYDGSIE